VGRRDRFSSDLIEAIERAEKSTWQGRRLLLRLAIDYSARECFRRASAILRAEGEGGAHTWLTALALAQHEDDMPPDVDLLIRTGGELRLSDLAGWECAYAELFFTPTMWPEFGAREFQEALKAFRSRNRRFGAVKAVPREKILAASAGPELQKITGFAQSRRDFPHSASC
jgi:undecaprenyl diphosphate synthase